METWKLSLGRHSFINSYCKPGFNCGKHMYLMQLFLVLYLETDQRSFSIIKGRRIMHTVLRTMGFFLLVKSVTGKKGYKTGASRRYYTTRVWLFAFY